MSRISALITGHLRLAWSIAVALIVAAAFAVGYEVRALREAERLTLLETRAERASVEVMAQTLSSSLNGSMSVIGLIQSEAKNDAQGIGSPNEPKLTGVLESIGRSYEATGVYIVGQNGIIRSSWENQGKPATGINVRFRPYFQMALEGKESIYAAVSQARGDRSLYFTAPVFSGTSTSSEIVGAAVARTGVTRIERLLGDKADIALLLSPQGIVFLGNRPDWVGQIATKPTQDQLGAIRELKQFGSAFDAREPAVLPIAVAQGMHAFDGGRYAVASATVQWNDPYGDWKVVLMEDLARAVPPTAWLWTALGSGALLLVLAGMVFHVLRNHHAQWVTAQQLESFAGLQQSNAAYRTQLAAASMRMQQAKSVAELAQTFLTEAHGMLGALQGVVYAFDVAAPGTLKLRASYGCADAAPLELTAGDGLLGQCAVEKQVRVIDAPGEGFWKIRSGLGATLPSAVLMAPMMHQDAVLGVVELAVLQARSDSLRERFAEMTAVLAMNLEMLGRTAGAPA